MDYQTVDLFTHAQLKTPGSFRVIHSADWHLGKTLGELSREEEHQLFLDWLLEEIRSREVDALIVAGDIFDSAYPAQSAQKQYYSFLSEVYHTTKCAVVVTAGNHDSPAQLEAPRQVLETLRVSVVGAIPDRPEDMLITLPNAEEPRLVVAAMPFLRDRDLRTGEAAQSMADIKQALVDGIAARYRDVAEASKPWLDRNVPVITTGHLTISNAKRSDSEREIHVGGIGSVSADIFPNAFQYVALGHLHRPQASDAKGVVRYSGSPIPLSFAESMDAKQVCMVDFSDGQLDEVEAIPVPTWRKLIQLRSKRSDLHDAIKDLPSSKCPLPTWVEVVVEDPVGGENLLELVREMATGLPFEVVRVIAGERSGVLGAEMESTSEAETGEDLLSDPGKVFEMRLAEEEGLAQGEREEILVAFNELLELHAQQKREEEDEGS